METTRPPGFPGNPPARMPRAPIPAKSPPPRPLSSDDVAFRPTHDVGPRNQRISGLNHAAYELPVNASRPGSPQAHASLGSGWRPTLAGWDWIPTGFRIRFRRLRHVILSPLTGLFPAHALVHGSRLTRNRAILKARHGPMLYDCDLPSSVIRFRTLHAKRASASRPPGARPLRPPPMIDLYRKKALSARAC